MTSIKELHGFDYIEKSKLNRKTISSLEKSSETPMPFKTYPDARNIAMKFEWNLSEARISPLIQQRRSLRKYFDIPIELEDIAFILWCSQGVTAKAGKHYLRATPSAGALYPFETYLFVNDVNGLEKGLYHFDVFNFALEYINPDAQVEQLVSSCLGQPCLGKAQATFIWTGVPSRNAVKYGDRAFRYLFLDIAHICQNVLMAAEAKYCGGCPIAAFFDDELNEFLDVDGENEFALYLAAVGKKM